jgi:hypothetical protein
MTMVSADHISLMALVRDKQNISMSQAGSCMAVTCPRKSLPVEAGVLS